MTRIEAIKRERSPRGLVLPTCPMIGNVPFAVPAKNILDPWPVRARRPRKDAEKGEGLMAKVLIVYTTRTGETKNIAERIAEGVRFQGIEAECLDVAQIKKATDLDGYDGYLFGSPTYHGDMLQPMKTFLFLAEKADLKGKAGGSFGAYGWSGEALDRIFGTMKNIFEMDMVGDPLRLKSLDLGGGSQMAQEYGRQIGKKISSP